MFQIDTYWAYFAKLDPTAVLKRLRHRMTVVHIKDGDISGASSPLGMGTAPVATAKELGLKIIVETEPNGNIPSMEHAKISFEYLTSIK